MSCFFYGVQLFIETFDRDKNTKHKQTYEEGKQTNKQPQYLG